MVLWVLFRVPTTTQVCCCMYPQQHILTKCVVVWCCGCCFEYPQQHILTKCVVVWCCGCCFEYPQQHILTKCVVKVMWVLYSKQHPHHHRCDVGVNCGSKQHPHHRNTTTHFNKMCCCMVLWVLFRVPTTTHFNKMCCCMVLWVLRPTTPFNNTFC